MNHDLDRFRFGSVPFFEGFQYSEEAEETLLRRISDFETHKGYLTSVKRLALSRFFRLTQA
jgi:hypothetical protein